MVLLNETSSDSSFLHLYSLRTHVITSFIGISIRTYLNHVCSIKLCVCVALVQFHGRSVATCGPPGINVEGFESGQSTSVFQLKFTSFDSYKSAGAATQNVSRSGRDLTVLRELLYLGQHDNTARPGNYFVS